MPNSVKHEKSFITSGPVKEERLNLLYTNEYANRN